ncbi:MAG: lipopolysaccharide export system permease protein [Planctomycetota bacterium]|jgi:lipopolysaccharide export system permease protein
MKVTRRLKLGSRLDRYVLSHFVGSYLSALFLMVGLFWILDMAANLDEFLEAAPDGTTASTLLIASYYLLNLPFLFLQVGPFVTLVAGMFTVTRLLKKNEISPVLSAGVSVHRLLLPVFLAGAVLAAGMFFLRETTVENLADRRDQLLDRLDEKRPERMYHDIVVHDLSGSMVFMDLFRPDATPPAIQGFSAVLFVHSSGETVKVRALSATWDKQAKIWRLEDGHRTIIGDQMTTTPLETLEGFEFTPKLALTYRRSRDHPLELSFGEIQELMRREPDDSAFRTLWHYLLTFPLANLILLLVGLPLLFTYERGRGTERMAFGGLLCIFYFAVDFVFRSLGLGGGLSPILAGWIPLLVVGSIGVALTDGIRT